MEASTAEKKQRRFDIDALRVIAIFLLIPFHTGRIFDDDGFYIKNAVLSPVIEEGIHYFLGHWRLALLFFVSGVGTRYALGFRSSGQYLRERTLRLFVPLVAGILLIVPPQIYYRNLFEGRFEGSYFAFYPTFFQGISPEGNFEWAHLWFLAYLFVYAVLMLPLFLYLRSRRGQAQLERGTRWLELRGRIYLLFIPLALGESFLRARYDGAQTLVGDWANLLLYGLLFSYGYVLYSRAALAQIFAKERRTSLLLALGTLAVLYALRWTGKVPSPETPLTWAALMALTTMMTWSWLCTLLGYAQIYLARDSPLLRRLSPLIYPVYIFHQTLIVVLGFYVIQWPVNLWLKFFVICGATLVLSLALAALSNRFALTRLLFGGPRVRAKAASGASM